MPLILLVACLGTESAPEPVLAATWATPVESEALAALGAVVSGVELERALARLGESQGAALARLDPCTEQGEAIAGLRDALLRWPALELDQRGDVEPVASRLLGAAELEARLASGEVTLRLADLEKACAAGEGTSVVTVARDEAVAMQLDALRAWSEVLRFVPAEAWEDTAAGPSVRGWLGLPPDATG
ncbi:MAG: hypothetical protein GY913_20100 [Proteobacteria bacterium]|nr:hypothetical protein [Pseudomonadota bacterium]MCP4919209.1 hypothetical protein [Pseudomonadota bacterium]